MRTPAHLVPLLLLAACASSSSYARPWRSGGQAVQVQAGGSQEGLATWYSDRLAGRPTASGEPYDPALLTAAHRTLPLGTRVEVNRVGFDRAVRVRINDRGPFGDARRIIDLSRAAAEVLGMLRAGVVPVEMRVLSLPPRRARR